MGGYLSTLNNNCRSHIYTHMCCFHCSTKDVFSTSPGSLLLQQSTAQDTGVQEKSFQYLTGLEDESQKGLVSRLKKTHRDRADLFWVASKSGGSLNSNRLF